MEDDQEVNRSIGLWKKNIHHHTTLPATLLNIRKHNGTKLSITTSLPNQSQQRFDPHGESLG